MRIDIVIDISIAVQSKNFDNNNFSSKNVLFLLFYNKYIINMLLIDRITN